MLSRPCTSSVASPSEDSSGGTLLVRNLMIVLSAMNFNSVLLSYKSHCCTSISRNNHDSSARRVEEVKPATMVLHSKSWSIADHLWRAADENRDTVNYTGGYYS